MTGPSLPHSPVETSALGFGGAYLTGGFELGRNKKLVEVALDTGFRHFDVAPLYGIGTAEDVLGAALGHRRHQVTIATKVGRPRPVLTLKTQLIRLAATPVRRWASGLVRKREVAAAPSRPSRRDFSLPFVEASLAESLRRLRTDYIDLFLLHEARLADIHDDLVAFLHRQREAGKVRAIGVASDTPALREILPVWAHAFDVLQYSWSPIDREPDLGHPNLFHITHRAIMRAWEPLRAWLADQPDAAQRLSDATGRDVRDAAVLSQLLLGAAMAHNPGGVTLVSSRRAARIRQNGAAMRDAGLRQAGQALIDALAKEPARPYFG